MSFNSPYRPGAFAHIPPVTKNIIIINVILFGATVLLKQTGVDLVAYLGLHYHLADDFKPHQFITYMFMHGGLWHLAFNMLGVYIFGQVLEETWGPKRYLIFYLLTGFGAAATHYLVMHFQVQEYVELVTMRAAELGEDDEAVRRTISGSLNNMVVVGASGSLFGLLGGFALLFPNREIYLYFMFPLKAKWLVVLYGAAELLSGLENSHGDNVAHFAHVGGLVAGLIIVLLWRKNRKTFY